VANETKLRFIRSTHVINVIALLEGIGAAMQMYNFDFMKSGQLKPIETVHRMVHNLEQARNHCINLFRSRAATVGADRVKVRENGGSKVLYSWPNDLGK
jgi:hypothetical protein